MKLTKVAQTSVLLFPEVLIVHQFCQRSVWATFWAIFTRTRLVTLRTGDNSFDQEFQFSQIQLVTYNK
jgi:hypothetical protein